MSLILSADEIAEVTERQQRPAQIRQLAAMGIPFRIRADGAPVVSRAAFDQAMGKGAPKQRAVEPDFSMFHAAQKKTA